LPRPLRSPLVPYTTLFRSAAPFTSVQDLAARAELDRRDMNVLAAANALKALAGDRRQAQWQSAMRRTPGLLKEAPIVEDCSPALDRKSTRLNSSHVKISYA